MHFPDFSIYPHKIYRLIAYELTYNHDLPKYIPTGLLIYLNEFSILQGLFHHSQDKSFRIIAFLLSSYAFPYNSLEIKEFSNLILSSSHTTESTSVPSHYGMIVFSFFHPQPFLKLFYPFIYIASHKNVTKRHFFHVLMLYKGYVHKKNRVRLESYIVLCIYSLFFFIHLTFVL